MVNLPMVKGYNVHHLLKLRHSKNGASVFRSHTAFPAPGSMVRNRQLKYPAWRFTG